MQAYLVQILLTLAVLDPDHACSRDKVRRENELNSAPILPPVYRQFVFRQKVLSLKFHTGSLFDKEAEDCSDSKESQGTKEDRNVTFLGDQYPGNKHG